jgi:serine/threonine protein kinase
VINAATGGHTLSTVDNDVIAGRYRLGEPLGLGGMASVRAADDLELGRRVAVKILAGDADRRRFDREARAVAALSHPNIVQVFDFGESDHGPFIVLELMEGGTLEDRLAAGEPLPDAETARIAREVAAGLAYAHERGLVHRDLKPANVLFDLEGRAKLTDFGIARFASAGTTLTEAGTILGTASYISPEQARGEPVGPASDVYSFGVILYRMLTGRLPFEGDSALAVASLHAHEEAPPLAGIRPDAPARLESTTMAALTKDPADRPSDGTALAAELEGVGSIRATRSVSSRRPAPVVVFAGAGAVVLAAGGLLLALLAGRGGGESPVLATSGPPTTATRGNTAPAPPPTGTREETTTATTEAATTETRPATTTLEPPTTATTATTAVTESISIPTGTDGG